MNKVGDPVATPVQSAKPAPRATEVEQAARAPVAVSAPVRPVQLSQDVRFVLDSDSGEPVAVVCDPVSGDVIRQIPSEEMLALRRQLGRLEGVMLRDKA